MIKWEKRCVCACEFVWLREKNKVSNWRLCNSLRLKMKQKKLIFNIFFKYSKVWRVSHLFMATFLYLLMRIRQYWIFIDSYRRNSTRISLTNLVYRHFTLFFQNLNMCNQSTPISFNFFSSLIFISSPLFVCYLTTMSTKAVVRRPYDITTPLEVTSIGNTRYKLELFFVQMFVRKN